MEQGSLKPAVSHNRVLTTCNRLISSLCKVMHCVAGLALLATFLLVVSDIIAIKVFSFPIPGGIELVTFLATVTIAAAIGAVAYARGNVAVDFLLGSLPPRAKTSLMVLTNILSCALFGILVTYTARYAAILAATGDVSMTQRIPYYPFVYFLAICYAVTLVVVAMQLVESIVEAIQAWSQ